MIQAKEHADFITVTCLEWKHLLADNVMKDTIIGSRRVSCKTESSLSVCFLFDEQSYSSDLQILGDDKRPNVQRDFLKYTGQRIFAKLEEIKSPLLSELRVDRAQCLLLEADALYRVYS